MKELTSNIKINNQYLNIILAEHNNIHVLIREIKRLGGNLSTWDALRNRDYNLKKYVDIKIKSLGE